MRDEGGPFHGWTRRWLVAAAAAAALAACRPAAPPRPPTDAEVRTYIVQSFEPPPAGERASIAWRSLRIEPARPATRSEMISANIPPNATVYPVRAEFTRTQGDEATERVVFLVFWRDREGRLDGSSMPHEGERTSVYPVGNAAE
jgi:hypothetical protein